MHIVRRAQRATGLSQEGLAKYLGMRRQQLSRWASGGKMDTAAFNLFALLEAEPATALRVLARVHKQPMPNNEFKGYAAAGKSMTDALRRLSARAAAIHDQTVRTVDAWNVFHEVLHPETPSDPR